jgi:hypothetical protein
MTDTSSVEADLWHVEATPGNVLVVTLDQLDDAFNQGLVNEHTRVWQDGMACAVPLHELLGLDDDGGEPDVPAPQYRHAIPPAPALVPSYPPPVAYRAAPTAPQLRTPAASHASAWPPVVARPSSVPPPASTPTAWQANAAPSVIPTAFDVYDDFVPFARPKRRGAMLFAVMSVLAIGVGGAVFAHNNGLTLALTPSPAAVAPPAPVVEPPRSHAYDPGNEPVHLREMPAPLEITKADTPSAVSAKVSPAEAASLREAALKAANAKGAKTSHAHAKAATARKVQSSRGKTGATSFKGTKSGSKYDPLNGAL